MKLFISLYKCLSARLPDSEAIERYNSRRFSAMFAIKVGWLD
jgi:hypothetical protein